MKNTVISAQNIIKSYARKRVLNGIDFTAERGEVIGILGANGAGKTTLLKSLLGLTRASGDITVCGLDPYRQQSELTKKVSFIADTATLPKWISCQQLLKYMEEMHPNFDIGKAEGFLENTLIEPQQKIKEMSKGMVVQLHLALVTAINSDLLVLDEPTLGLDIIRRTEFYNLLMGNYFDNENTILITTHQIEEIEHVLTRVVFVDQGRIVFDFSIAELERFRQVHARQDCLSDLDALQPIAKTESLEGIIYLFDNVDKTTLSQFGQVKIPRLTDLFVAITSTPVKETHHVE